MEEIAFRPALELAALIRDREVSPVEVIEEYLNRIDKLDPTINAYVTVVGDRALADARKAADEVASGGDLAPFHGVPIAIKDLVETAGIKTTYSSRNYADYVPDRDSAVVRRIKEAGFIILGKTNASEFGIFPVTESELNGVGRNPWNTDLTPGGSSGGAAAALAAGLTPVAHGTDGGGSVRIPASCCGLFGIKPTRGLVSLAPYLGESWAGCSTSGSLGRTVADAAALLDVMSGDEPGDPYWAPPLERPLLSEVDADPGTLRIGYQSQTPTGVPVDPLAVAALEDGVKLLESQGHEVEEVAFDWIDPDITSHFIKIVQTSTAYHDGIDPELLEPATRALMEAAQATDSLTYIRAIRGLQAISRTVAEKTGHLDLIVTPTLALPPVPVGWMFEEEDPWAQLIRAGMFIPFTPFANITGRPAVSVPLFWSDEGIPIGVQLAGEPGSEATLIRVSAALERERPWRDRRPPVS